MKMQEFVEGWRMLFGTENPRRTGTKAATPSPAPAQPTPAPEVTRFARLQSACKASLAALDGKPAGVAAKPAAPAQSLTGFARLRDSIRRQLEEQNLPVKTA